MVHIFLCALCAFLWLLIVLWHEAGAVFVIAGFPDDDDLVDGDVALFAIVVAKMQDAHFYFENFTTETRPGAAENIDLLADQLR
jgi:hypothetical protein